VCQGLIEALIRFCEAPERSQRRSTAIQRFGEIG